MLVDLIPNNKIGDFAVTDFEVSEKQAEINKVINPRHIIAGYYKRLSYKRNVTIMTNSPQEISEITNLCKQAFGDMLIIGLGLGVMIDLLLENDKIKSITIVEKNIEVINLVYPSFKHIKMLSIINEDAFDYQPKRNFDHIWHDIWNSVFLGYKKEMITLKEKYKNYGTCQWCWSEELL